MVLTHYTPVTRRTVRRADYPVTWWTSSTCGTTGASRLATLHDRSTISTAGGAR